jgi:type VI secretion system protein ImpH
VRQTRNAEGLRQILRAYLGVPVEIVEFVPGWLAIGEQQRTTLRTRGRAPALGGGALLGVAVRDAQSKFEIRLGPLTRAQYANFLPTTQRTRQLVQWVREYGGVEWAWTLRLLLAADQMSAGTLGRGQALGWDRWLGTHAGNTAAADLVYEPETHLRQARPTPAHH